MLNIIIGYILDALFNWALFMLEVFASSIEQLIFYKEKLIWGSACTQKLDREELQLVLQKWRVWLCLYNYFFL